MQNRSLPDEIREYWQVRAATYDQSQGHGAMSEGEASAWARLIARHLGAGEGRRALDIGCGTGVMSARLAGCGFTVTGLDFTPAMLERARARLPGSAFRLADAGNTMEPASHYDAILARNLVWTLPDPATALRDWLRALRPGGRLMVIDGDFARLSRVERLMPLIDRLLGRREDGHSVLTAAQWAHHHRIMAELPHGRGLRSGVVQALLREAGFTDLREEGLAEVHNQRHRRLSRGWLIARSQHRFVISVTKPLR